MAHSSKDLLRGSAMVNEGNRFAKLVDLQEDIDPAVLARESIDTRAANKPKTQLTLRHSAATLQRCKTVNTLIEKLYTDIQMLTSVKDALAVVKTQLEKEKIDTLNAEKISKEALSAFVFMKDSGMLATVLEEIATKQNNTGARVNIEEVNVSSFSNQNFEMDESFMDNLRNGLDEPDIVPVEQTDEDDGGISGYPDVTF